MTVRTASVSVHAAMAALVIYHVAKLARRQRTVIAFEQLVRAPRRLIPLVDLLEARALSPRHWLFARLLAPLFQLLLRQGLIAVHHCARFVGGCRDFAFQKGLVADARHARLVVPRIRTIVGVIHGACGLHLDGSVLSFLLG